jgi:hypothetical protein
MAIVNIKLWDEMDRLHDFGVGDFGLGVVVVVGVEPVTARLGAAGGA